jgi:calcineurin-like phosphoesterase family protein
MIWFSSDFHFGHSNIAGPSISNWDRGFRNFDSVAQMDKTIIQTLNKYVKSDDVLYFLGDFAFGGHLNIPSYRHGLNVQTIHLTRGNHDHHIDKYANLFTSISDVTWCKDKKDKPIFLSHYSHRVWEGSHKGYIHLYGHSHDSIPDHGRSMDVGIDTAYRLTGEYRPFSINEIIQIMDSKDIAHVDHHGINTNAH